MADKDLGNPDGPSLELPSFGFGRKRRNKSAEPTEAVETDSPEESVPQTPVETAQSSEVETIFDEEEAAPAPAPKTEPTPRPTPTPNPEPTVALEDPDTESTAVLSDVAPAASIPGASAAAAAVAAQGDAEPVEPGPSLKDRFEPLMRLPDLDPRAAAAVTGAVIGVLAVAATFASLHLCGLVKGTTSCGGPGLILLVAILVALVFLGSTLLRGFRQPDPFSTSFLAVGLLAVIALLFLVEVLFSWAMIIVIPLVSAGTYVLSHWVTMTFIEPARDDGELVDR